jgi:PAS domain S-box-containing protein
MALSREKLERLTDHSTDIVVATDRKGIVVYYNDGATRSLGYLPDELLGSFVGNLYPSVDEAKRVMEAMREKERDVAGGAGEVQTVFVSKDGTEIPVAISGTVLYGDEGEEDGSIGYAKDLREILRKDQLATLGEVVIGLSHEINNPLAVILNQAELLERDVGRLAGEADILVETERIDAVRREVVRISEILTRLGELADSETYETVGYTGPARMLDLSKRRSPDAEIDPRLAGRHILVVDDDLGIRETLKEVLEGWGCAVETAEDGACALDCIANQPVELVLSDVVMPNMDGHELFLALQERRPELPVLMMTAFHYDKDHIIKRSRMEGVKGVIFKKPVDPAKLREIMVETLSRSS